MKTVRCVTSKSVEELNKIHVDVKKQRNKLEDNMAKSIDKEKLGSNIRKARESYNWSQERLAEYINVSTKTISNYEAGNSMPTMSAFIAIAEALGYTLDEIKDGDFEKGPFGGDKRIAELFYDISSEERELLIEKMTNEIKTMKAERQ